MQETALPIQQKDDFKRTALQWATQFPVCCLLDSNDYPHKKHDSENWVLAIDAISATEAGAKDSFEALKQFHAGRQQPVFGFLSYDLKNELEQLQSRHHDMLGFPPLFFFEPRYIFKEVGQKILFNRNFPEAAELYDRISGYTPKVKAPPLSAIDLKFRTDYETYCRNVSHIKSRICEGDFYEMNYCIEVYAENADIDPVAIFHQLNSSAQAPFSAFFKYHDSYLICASPERFLRRQGSTIMSQPIKGTTRKGQTPEEDAQLKEALLHSIKERAENVMIVDLVRNDLAKSAITGSVKVDELFGLYEFNTVHHMVSTVSATLNGQIHFTDAIKNAFPMGSMTGAPKIEVMKQIDELESFRRGLFSGAVGYITPASDFDFNVVIRSIFYNAATRYLSIRVGSAITFDSTPGQEWQEVMLKAERMVEVLKQSPVS
jgi:para-aminobenzoate synthetase component 1